MTERSSGGDSRRWRVESLAFGMHAYTDQCDALADLIDIAVASEPLLDSPESRTTELRAVMNAMPARELADLRALLQKYADRGDEAVDRIEFLRDLLSLCHEDTSWSDAVLVSCWELTTRSLRGPMLMQALLVSAVGAFEAMVGNIVSMYFQEFPGSLEDVARDQEREFSLKELRQLTSLADVEEVALGRRVDAVLFGGLKGWQRFFSRYVRADLPELVEDWVALEEIFERRHVAVHHAGRASRRYVRFSSASGAIPHVQPGEWLPCTPEYLRVAADRLHAGGIGMALAMWQRLRDEDAGATNARSLLTDLGRISDRSLQRGGFRLTTTIVRWLRANLPDAVSDEFVVRELLASKRDATNVDARNAIARWVPRHPTRRLDFARLVLLDELDAACDLLVSLAASGEISTYDVVAWPVVRELGSDPRVTLARERIAQRT